MIMSFILDLGIYRECTKDLFFSQEEDALLFMVFKTVIQNLIT